MCYTDHIGPSAVPFINKKIMVTSWVPLLKGTSVPFGPCFVSKNSIQIIKSCSCTFCQNQLQEKTIDGLIMNSVALLNNLGLAISFHLQFNAVAKYMAQEEGILKVFKTNTVLSIAQRNPGIKWSYLFIISQLHRVFSSICYQ